MGKSPAQSPELPSRLRELPDAADLMRLNAVVLRACEHQPGKRFHSAEELGVALAGLRAQQAIRESGQPPGTAALPSNGLKLVILFRGEAVADAQLSKELAGHLAAEGYGVGNDALPALPSHLPPPIENETHGSPTAI